MKATTIIGIAGGSGSGKTTVTNEIMKNLEGHSVALLAQDYYYKDQKHLTFDERLETNYDHPFAFDNDLLIENLKDLKNGKAVEVPTYDYASHTRSDITIDFKPKDVIIVEGIFALENKVLRDMMDVKIYVDTDADLRILRRLTRDTKERGRSMDSVINQYLSVVRPMHDQFIEPTKKYADIIIPEGGSNKVARSFGDLSENSEYDAAKDEQGFIEQDIQRIEHMLRNALIIEDTGDNNVVKIGKTVTFVELPGDEEESYQIVGSAESDAFNGKISNESPMAKALIGKGLDDEVRVPLPNGGEMNVKIVNIQ
ncbi:uridine kinase [Staphylococcus aureus]